MAKDKKLKENNKGKFLPTNIEAPQTKVVEKKKNDKKKADRPSFFKRISIALKNTFGELKHVTWTPLKKAFAQTGVVIGVVVATLVVLLVVDLFLAWLFKMITGQGMSSPV